MAAVGYTPSYILIKNSWGSEWGDQGLFKFARADHACGIHLPDNNFLVVMARTGEKDGQDEADPLVYVEDGTVEPPTRPTEGPLTTRPGPTTEDNSCRDKQEGCLSYFCGFYVNYKTDCRKTCGYC